MMSMLLSIGLPLINENHSRIAEAITNALNLGKGYVLLLDPDTYEEQLFSMHAYSPKSGLSYSVLEAARFFFQ